MDKNFKAIEKMLFHIRRLERAFDGKSYEDLLENELLQDSAVTNISQIGESVVLLDEEFREKYSEIQWKKLKVTRNMYIHNYDGINYRLMWQVLNKDLPKLKQQLEELHDILR